MPYFGVLYSQFSVQSSAAKGLSVAYTTNKFVVMY